MNENKIAEDIYRINLSLNLDNIKNINIHLIKNINGYTLIDTGWNIEGKTDELLSKLDELQINLDEINQIILTHLHIDHFGLVNKLRKLTKFELCANPRELIFYKNFETNIFNKLLTYTGFQESEIKEIIQMLDLVKNIIPRKIDRWIYGNEIIKSRKNKSRIISTPGHTPGNLSIYNSKEKLFISGDHILPKITSNITFYPFIKNYNPLDDYFKSLNEINQLDIIKISPSHGDIFFNINRRIREIIKHHNNRLKEIDKACITDESGHLLNTPYEVANEISWSKDKFSKLTTFDKFLAVLETITHIKFLKKEIKINDKELKLVDFY